MRGSLSPETNVAALSKDRPRWADPFQTYSRAGHNLGACAGLLCLWMKSRFSALWV
jgi:hypothetical protein